MKKRIFTLFFSLILHGVSTTTMANPNWEIFQTLQAERFLTRQIEKNPSLRLHLTSTRPSPSQEVEYTLKKETSISRFNRLMGPSRISFQKMIDDLEKENPLQSQIFLREFLKGWIQGSLVGGKKVHFRKMDWEVLGEQLGPKLKKLMAINELIQKHQHQDFHQSGELKKILKECLDLAGDAPFSFLAQGTRERILQGTFPGLTPNIVKKSLSDYHTWKLHWGIDPKVVQEVKVDPENKIVQITFSKVKGHGSYHHLLSWYERQMGPGKSWGDLKNTHTISLPSLSPSQYQEFKQKILQPYEKVARSLALVSGVINGDFHLFLQKSEQTSDQKLLMGMNEGQLGQAENLGKKMSIDFHFPTTHGPTQNLIEESFLGRFFSGKWDDLHGLKDVDLSPGTYDEIAQRLGLEIEEVKAFFKLMEEFSLDPDVFLPLWNWDKVPFLSWKKELIKPLSQQLIKQLLQIKNLSLDDFKDALKTWAKASDIFSALEAYIKPKDWDERWDHLDPLYYMPADRFGQLRPSSHLLKDKIIPVNNIGIGIEYTAKYPLKSQAEFVGRLQDQSFHFLRHKVNWTLPQRNGILQEVALRLNHKMRDRGPFKLAADSDVHLEGNAAHENGIGGENFTFPDPRDPLKRWRVEWDGVQRTYPTAELQSLSVGMRKKYLEHTSRGGHIEIVSPLINPSFADTKKLFQGMRDNDLYPDRKIGGGHLNFNLEVFMNEKDPKPRELARLISLFLQHQGILTFLFTDISRVRQSIAPDVSENFVKQLSDFKGSMTELLQLIYNERFFNTLIGRKTRYTLMNITNIFQSVIPRELKTKDFDIKDPYTLWRPEFRVNPKTLKAEFRMVDAPLTAAQSALQIKIFRALFYKALNSNEPLPGKVSPIQHEFYAARPEAAYKDLENLLLDLKMDPQLEMKNYIGFIHENIQSTRTQMDSPFYRTVKEKLQNNPKAPDHVWGKALENPDPEKINASDFEWDKKLHVTEEAINYNLVRQRALQEAENLRLKFGLLPSWVHGPEMLLRFNPSWVKQEIKSGMFKDQLTLMRPQLKGQLVGKMRKMKRWFTKYPPSSVMLVTQENNMNNESVVKGNRQLKDKGIQSNVQYLIKLFSTLSMNKENGSSLLPCNP